VIAMEAFPPLLYPLLFLLLHHIPRMVVENAEGCTLVFGIVDCVVVVDIVDDCVVVVDSVVVVVVDCVVGYDSDAFVDTLVEE